MRFYYYFFFFWLPTWTMYREYGNLKEILEFFFRYLALSEQEYCQFGWICKSTIFLEWMMVCIARIHDIRKKCTMHVGISTPCNIREYKGESFNACPCKVFLCFFGEWWTFAKNLFFFFQNLKKV